jgi:xanthine/uracil permease
MLGNVIGGFIVILIGVTLAPSVANEIFMAQTGDGNASSADNITGSAETLIGLGTLFYCLAIAVTAIGMVTMGLRKAGMM